MKTLKRNFSFPVILLLLTALLMNSCKKEDGDYIYDDDGNKYSVVHIGDHYWMTENLKTMTYNDGTGLLVLQHDALEWASAGPACCVYDPDGVDGIGSEAEMRTHYGVLYNWYAVNTGKLCPTGWRIPTNDEWTELITELGGEAVAGGKMKSTRTEPDDHPRWNSPNTGATNDGDFRAFPAGCRTSLGEFFDLGYYGYWWTGTEYDASFAIDWYIPNDDVYIDYEYRKKRSGYSVRCIKE